jgi:hypothetical protein
MGETLLRSLKGSSVYRLQVRWGALWTWRLSRHRRAPSCSLRGAPQCPRERRTNSMDWWLMGYINWTPPPYSPSYVNPSWTYRITPFPHPPRCRSRRRQNQYRWITQLGQRLCSWLPSVRNGNYPSNTVDLNRSSLSNHSCSRNLIDQSQQSQNTKSLTNTNTTTPSTSTNSTNPTNSTNRTSTS